jgi:hypothetical protein
MPLTVRFDALDAGDAPDLVDLAFIDQARQQAVAVEAGPVELEDLGDKIG